MPTPDPKSFHERVVYFLVCDQCRVEEGNKNLYIGVYGDSIVVDNFPAVIQQLSFVLCFRATRKSEDIAFELRLPGVKLAESQVIHAQARGPNQTITANIIVAPCVVLQPGAISVHYRFQDGSEFVREIRVIPKSEFDSQKW